MSKTIARNLITVKEARKVLVKRVGAQQGVGNHALTTPAHQTLEPQRVEKSKTKFLIPVKSDPAIKLNYTSFGGQLRFGKILEDLDTSAVIASYQHNVRKTEEETYSLSIVTAAVDSIAVHKPETLPEDGDLFLSSWVSWVGTSSMEVSLQLHNADSSSTEENSILDAKFLMVARGTDNRAALVNQLLVESPEEKQMFKLGSKAKDVRKKQAQVSLFSKQPDGEEAQLVHSMFLKSVDLKLRTFRSNVKSADDFWMEDSKLKTSILCFPENKNIHGKIFGGFVMRKALEHSWSNAFAHCGAEVHPVFIDDIAFRKPVSIGDLLYLSSQVVYTEDNLVQVRCHAEVKNVIEKTQVTTNEFYFTFAGKPGVQVPRVVPVRYAEYMMYLDGRRHLQVYRDH